MAKDLSFLFPGTPRKIASLPIAYKRVMGPEVVARLTTGLRCLLDEFKALGMQRVIVGMSGGLDSTVSAAILVESGLDVGAVIIELDSRRGLSPEVEAGLKLADRIAITHRFVNATQVFTGLLNLLPEQSTLARVHLRSRLINNIIFQCADNEAAIVVDTTDKSEDVLKMYEESFRGHVAPCISLYKSELYDLADFLGLPELRERPSGCPELVDFDAFGVDWEFLDAVLYLLVERGLRSEDLATLYDLDIEWLRNIQNRVIRQPLRTAVHRIELG